MSKFANISRVRPRLVVLSLAAFLASVPAVAAIYCADYTDSCADGFQVTAQVCCEEYQEGVAQCGCTSWTDGPDGGTWGGCGLVATGCVDLEE